MTYSASVRLVGAILLVLGIAVDVAGGVMRAQAVEKNATGEHVTGTVVSVSVAERHRRRNTDYYSVAVVEYRTVSGQELSAEVRMRISGPAAAGYVVGEAVELVYAMDDPTGAVLAGAAGWREATLVLVAGGFVTGIGLVLFVTGAVLVRRSRRVSESAPLRAG